MDHEFSKKERVFYLLGPAGRLEVLSAHPKASPQPITAIISHPQPPGGTMNNKVVTTIAKAMDLLGVKTLRFNFRGVGKSEGVYDNGVGETEDLKAVLRWVRSVCPEDRIWLAGFSFGAYVSAKVANDQSGIAQLVTIAPTLNHYDFAAFTQIACPWFIVSAGSDELVSVASVEEFMQHPPVPAKLVVIKAASHFFHGKLIELRAVLVEGLSDQLPG